MKEPTNTPNPEERETEIPEAPQLPDERDEDLEERDIYARQYSPDGDELLRAIARDQKKIVASIIDHRILYYSKSVISDLFRCRGKEAKEDKSLERIALQFEEIARAYTLAAEKIREKAEAEKRWPIHRIQIELFTNPGDAIVQ